MAPAARIVDANGPLKASFAKSPFYSELAANPELIGPYGLDKRAVAAINDPVVLEALRTSSS